MGIKPEQGLDMERLTSHEKRISGADGVCCTHFDSLDCYQHFGNCSQGCPWEEAAWNRLASYEDTGLTPEEVKLVHETLLTVQKNKTAMWNDLQNYLQAEADGRLVVLPCKVGDKVWFKTYIKNAMECIGIQPHEIKRVEISFACEGDRFDTMIPSWAIGKSVFLTREEAEAALTEAGTDG